MQSGESIRPRHCLSGFIRNQLLSSSERHGAVADSSDLPHSENVVPVEFRANRNHHACVSGDRLANATSGGSIYRSTTTAVLASGWNVRKLSGPAAPFCCPQL